MNKLFTWKKLYFLNINNLSAEYYERHKQQL